MQQKDRSNEWETTSGVSQEVGKDTMEEMEKNTKKPSNFLLILTVGWALLSILQRLLLGDWLSIDFLLNSLIVILVIFFGIVLLVSNTIVVFVALFRWLTRKKQPHVVTFLPLVIILVVPFLVYEIPTRPAVTFYLHRDEFIGLVDSAVSEIQNTGKLGLRLPGSPLYKEASVYRDASSRALVGEFIIGNDYLPLVYISTDNLGDTYGACFENGGPVEKLEPKWYVCSQDWGP